MEGVRTLLAESSDGYTYEQLARAIYGIDSPTRPQVVAVYRASRRWIELGQAVKLARLGTRKKLIVGVPPVDERVVRRIRDLASSPDVLWVTVDDLSLEIFGTRQPGARQRAAILATLKGLRDEGLVTFTGGEGRVVVDLWAVIAIGPVERAVHELLSVSPMLPERQLAQAVFETTYPTRGQLITIRRAESRLYYAGLRDARRPGLSGFDAFGPPSRA